MGPVPVWNLWATIHRLEEGFDCKQIWKCVALRVWGFSGWSFLFWLGFCLSVIFFVGILGGVMVFWSVFFLNISPEPHVVASLPGLFSTLPSRLLAPSGRQALLVCLHHLPEGPNRNVSLQGIAPCLKSLSPKKGHWNATVWDLLCSGPRAIGLVLFCWKHPRIKMHYSIGNKCCAISSRQL